MSIEREPLEQRVYNHLLRQLSVREFEPGAPLKAAKLAANLNVSRTTVRKALSRLVDDGWASQTPAGRMFVARCPKSAPRDAADLHDQKSQIDAAYWRIFDWILNGNARPGKDVQPRKFADEFGVSMGTIRQALDGMSRDGILVRTLRRGWRFGSLAWQDVIDTIEIRTMFESEVLRRAGTRIPHAILSSLRGETEAVLERIDTLSEHERRLADYHFHSTLAENSTSAVLIDLIKPLIRRSMYAGMNCPPEKRHKARSFREHVTILESLLRGDAPAAIEQFQAHMSRTLQDSLRPLVAPAAGVEN